MNHIYLIFQDENYIEQQSGLTLSGEHDELNGNTVEELTLDDIFGMNLKDYFLSFSS